MEKRPHLKLLKASLLFFLALNTSAQEWDLTATKNINQQPVSQAVDFQGNIYLGFADGRLSKYGPDGEFLQNFSLSNNSAISLIDAQNNLKPFLFYFDNQTITILDRFSTIPKIYHLADFGVEFGMMACPAPDGDIWVIENNPQRLNKVNLLRKSTVIEAQISLGNTIRMMQAYQNFLFVGDEKGIHFFDQFGGFVRSIEIEDLLNFHIKDGNLVVFTRKEMLSFSLSKSTVQNKINLPDLPFQAAFKMEEGYLFVENKRLSFFKAVLKN